MQRPDMRLSTARIPILLPAAVVILLGLPIGWLTVVGKPVYVVGLLGLILFLWITVLGGQHDLYQLSMQALFLSLPLISTMVIDVGASIRVSYVLALCAMLCGLYQGRLPPLSNVPILGWLAPFLCASLLSMGLTVNVPNLAVQAGSQLRGLALRTVIQNGQLLLMAAVLFLTVVYCSTKRRFSAAIDLITVATFFTAAYGMYEFVAQLFGLPFVYINNAVNNILEYGYNPAWIWIGGYMIPRPFSTFDEPKNLANYLLIASILAMAHLRWQCSGLRRCFTLLTIALAMTVFLFTNSRGAYIGAMCALVAAVIHRGSLSLFLKSLAAVAAVVVAVYLLVLPILVPDINLQAAVDMAIERSEQSLALEGRKTAWDTAIEIFKAHPLVGVGFGNISFYMAAAEGLNQVVDVPSLYLRLLAELGVVGLAIFFVFILRVLAGAFVEGRRHGLDRWTSAMCAAVFAAMIGDLVQRVSFVGLATDAYLWVLWGLAVAISTIARNEWRSRGGVHEHVG